MNCIVAVDKNWAIGYQNKLLVSIPADMRFFRDETTGKVVILGKKTMQTFPGGLPLKNRTNIIITHDKEFKVKDSIVANSIEEVLQHAKNYKSEDIYVIGGDSIYRQLLPYCKVVYLTKIDFSYQADTYFPNLDEREDWVLVKESEEQTYYDLPYTFCRYEKRIGPQ